MICLELNRVVLINFLLIDATDTSKIRSNHYR